MFRGFRRVFDTVMLNRASLFGFDGAAAINRHVHSAHKRRPGPDTIDSSQAEHFAPIIKNMIAELFDSP